MRPTLEARRIGDPPEKDWRDEETSGPGELEWGVIAAVCCWFVFERPGQQELLAQLCHHLEGCGGQGSPFASIPTVRSSWCPYDGHDNGCIGHWVKEKTKKPLLSLRSPILEVLGRSTGGDLLRSVLNIKNGVKIKSDCYIDSVGENKVYL